MFPSLQSNLPRSGTFALGLLMAGAAAAQDSEVPTAASEPQALERVIIQTKRRALYNNRDVNAGALGVQDLHELPFSIGSFSSELIDNQRARTVLDVLKNDASVQATSYGGAYDNISVRGFSNNGVNSVRRDGLLTTIYSDIPLENKDRVDVLKGLSGFLYGVGEPGGLVNYVLKRPARTPFTSLQFEARSHGGLYTNVDHNLVSGDGIVGVRLNAAAENQGDFTHAGDLSRTLFAGAVDIRLGAQSLLRLDFDYQEKQIASQPLLPLLADGSLLDAGRLDPRTLLGQPWMRYTSRAGNLGARLEHSLSDQWNLIAQAALSRMARDARWVDVYVLGVDGRIGNSFDDGDYWISPNDRYTTLAAQVFLDGRVQAGRFSHDIVAGLADARMRLQDGSAIALTNQTGNIFAPADIPEPVLPGPGSGNNDARQRQPALFVSDMVRLTPHWRVLGGLRHVAYRRDTRKADGESEQYHEDVTLPSASVIWLPTPSATVYAGCNEGLEEGAYAPLGTGNAGERLNPIHSKQVELGVKLLVGEALSMNAAVFRSERPRQAIDTTNVFRTLGRQRHQGLELNVAGALGRAWSAVAGATWLDAVVTGTGDADDGKHPAGVARLQAHAFVDWRLAAVPGLSLNGGVFHVGGRPVDQANTVYVPAYTRLDAGARWATRINAQPTVWRLQVENLGDERYWAHVTFGKVMAAAPRTLRLSGEWVF